YAPLIGGSGGFSIDDASAIAVDSAGNAYVAGVTNATDFPMKNAFQSSYAGGTDAWVAKFDTGGVSVYSTYFGGSGTENVGGIAVDATGAAYITGTTDSASFPVSAGAFQSILAGGFFPDAFVAKLTPTGQRSYATLVGGNGFETLNGGGTIGSGGGIAVDASGNAVIAGTTQSSDFPVKGAFQPSLSS